MGPRWVPSPPRRGTQSAFADRAQNWRLRSNNAAANRTLSAATVPWRTPEHRPIILGPMPSRAGPLPPFDGSHVRLQGPMRLPSRSGPIPAFQGALRAPPGLM